MYVTRRPAAILTKCSFLAAAFPLADKPALNGGHNNNNAQIYHNPRTHYATQSENFQTLNWPSKPLSQLTPYEIFGQPHSSPYLKSNFYHLVKLYHPDVAPPSEHPCALLSKAIRTERFRLIVAANALLADPEKKKTYDKYGIGWNSNQRDARDVRTSTAATYAAGPWKHSPAGNATWEDWERWYRAEGMRSAAASRAKEDAKPLTTHANFVLIIMLISFTGVLIQLARVDNFSSKYEEQRDRRDRDISRTLNRLRRERAELGGKDGSIQAFLKMRDPDAYGGAEEVREERMQRLLPQGEVCMSDGTRSTDID